MPTAARISGSPRPQQQYHWGATQAEQSYKPPGDYWLLIIARNMLVHGVIANRVVPVELHI
jgi:hypothetical protein